MLELLNFIFRDLWTFVGVVILVECVGAAIAVSLSPLVGLIRIIKRVKEKGEQ